MGLTTKDKLDIANSGGLFEETGASSWTGTSIRKGAKLGVVVRDLNGAVRALTVRFHDGTEEEIVMNNIGQDAEYIHEYEWQDKTRGTWYRF